MEKMIRALVILFICSVSASAGGLGVFPIDPDGTMRVWTSTGTTPRLSGGGVGVFPMEYDGSLRTWDEIQSSTAAYALDSERLGGVLADEYPKLDDDNTFTGENIFNSPIIHGAGIVSLGGNPRGTGAIDLQTALERENDSQVASGDYSVIGGGMYNTASGHYSSVGGGDNNIASGHYSSVGGGVDNTVSGDYSTVGGGLSNKASGLYSSVGGGLSNKASSYGSAVVGGDNNTASGRYSTVGGGCYLTSSADGSYTIGDSQNTYFTNDVEDGFYARFQGGHRFGNGTTDFLHLTADGEGVFSGPVLHNGIQSTGGDERGLYAVDLQTHRTDNSQVASGDYSVIGGGYNNTAADRASVGGGCNNIASGEGATVAGGINNTASGYRAFVGSGQSNTASGEYAVVCGGYNNTASGNQAAILGGSNVEATAKGASAMGDGQGDGFINNTPNSLAVRFDNGVRFAKTATTDLMTIDKEGVVQAKSSMVANSFKQEPIALNIENALEKSRNMSAVDNGIGMRKMDYSSIPVEVISQQTVIKRSVRDKKTGIVYDDIKDLPNIEVKSGGETISEKVEYDLIEEEYTYPIVDIAGLIELNRLAVLELEDRVEELENHIKIIHEVFNQMIVEAGGEEIDFDILAIDMKQSGGNITAGVVSAVAIILAVFGLFKKEDDEGGDGGLGGRN